MSSTLLRLGLWVSLLGIVAYVLHETFSEQELAEMIPVALVVKAIALGVILAVAGMIMRMLEKGSKVVAKNRCVVCRAPVTPGAIYCRAHLRAVLHHEEDLTHTTKSKRR